MGCMDLSISIDDVDDDEHKEEVAVDGVEHIYNTVVCGGLLHFMVK